MLRAERNLSINYSCLWAKTAVEGDPSWHPLILHLLDVAVCADAVLQREPETTRIQLLTYA